MADSCSMIDTDPSSCALGFMFVYNVNLSQVNINNVYQHMIVSDISEINRKIISHYHKQKPTVL